MTQLREIMTPAPVSIAPSTSVVDAARLMRERDIGSLPVAENGNLLGIVTDRDLVVRGIAEMSIDTQIRDIMSPDVVCLSPNDDLRQAEETMARHGIRRLPVCEGSQLVGIGDVAVQGSEQIAGEVMEETGPSSR